jgi:hypothetical protein
VLHTILMDHVLVAVVEITYLDPTAWSSIQAVPPVPTDYARAAPQDIQF